jgi:hypothetical protein
MVSLSISCLQPPHTVVGLPIPTLIPLFSSRIRTDILRVSGLNVDSPGWGKPLFCWGRIGIFYSQISQIVGDPVYKIAGPGQFHLRQYSCGPHMSGKPLLGLFFKCIGWLIQWGLWQNRQRLYFFTERVTFSVYSECLKRTVWLEQPASEMISKIQLSKARNRGLWLIFISSPLNI